MLNLFDTADFSLRKRAQVGILPPVPETHWRPPANPPDLSNAVAIALDCETFDPDLITDGPGWARGPRGHIVGVSLAAVDRSGARGRWYFPVRHRHEPEHNLRADGVFPWLKTVLENSLPKVGANLLYDIGWLTEENIFVNGELHDVQFAEALLDEEAKVALDVLGNKYLGEHKATSVMYDWIRAAYKPNERELRGDIYRTSPRLVGHYAEMDADLPLRIIEKQLPIIHKEGLDYIYRLENDLIPLLVRMRRKGVSVDVLKAEALAHELGEDAIRMYSELEHEYGFRLKGTDSRQLGLLFDHVGIKYPMTKAAKPSPNIEKEWLDALEHPLGDFLNELRHAEKIKSTFCEGYILDKNVNGKLYPQLHPLKSDHNGTLVGRFASSHPNIQNISKRSKLGKRVRKLFIPDKGHAHWARYDFSQIHYRILAHFAIGPGSDELRHRYCSDPKTDYHMDVYMKVAPLLGWSTTDKAIIKEKRTPIKNVNFGLLYGQGDKSLSYKAGLTKEQATGFFKAYHEGAPYVKPTMEAIAREAAEVGYVTTLLGRRVRFKLWEPCEGYGHTPMRLAAALEQWGSNIKVAFQYRAVNYKFQGSEPDIIKTAMRDLDRSGVFDDVGVPRLTVHDELDWSVENNSPETQEAFKYIGHMMENAVKMRIPINCEFGKGNNWGEAD